MSYQRAVVNCRRCYHIMHDGQDISETSNLANIQEDTEAYEPRERAMQALEEEMDRVIENPEQNKDRFAGSPLSVIDFALAKCMNCQYKKPEIAEFFDSSDGSV